MFSFGYFPGVRLRVFIQPLKMDLTEGSETSAKLNLTPGKYPKENIQVSEHAKNLKSRMYLNPLTDYITRIMSMEESVQQVIMQSIQELDGMGSGTSSIVVNPGRETDSQLQRILGELEAAAEARDQLAQRCHELDMQVCTGALGCGCLCIKI
jgi:hypothetical protein